MASVVNEKETLQAVVDAVVVVVIILGEAELEAPAARDFVDGKDKMTFFLVLSLMCLLYL